MPAQPPADGAEHRPVQREAGHPTAQQRAPGPRPRPQRGAGHHHGLEPDRAQEPGAVGGPRGVRVARAATHPQATAATRHNASVTARAPAPASSAASTSEPATKVKKPNTLAGASASAARCARCASIRQARATVSTANPARPSPNSGQERRRAPLAARARETIPVAMTGAKHAGARPRTRPLTSCVHVMPGSVPPPPRTPTPPVAPRPPAPHEKPATREGSREPVGHGRCFTATWATLLPGKGVGAGWGWRRAHGGPGDRRTRARAAGDRRTAHGPPAGLARATGGA